MKFVYPSSVTFGQITRKVMPKLSSITTNDMVKCRRAQQKKMKDFDYLEEYLKGIYQTKYYYGSVKKSSFTFRFTYY